MASGFLGVHPPPVLYDPTWARQLQITCNGLLLGKSNNTGSVTLTANTTTTTLTDTRLSDDSVLLFSPTTANAAVATGNLYVGTYAKGSATLTHANTATTDRTFRFAIIG